jgi:hypothetical protein
VEAFWLCLDVLHSADKHRILHVAQMQRMFLEMSDSERLLPLQVGLDMQGNGSAFVARNLVGVLTPLDMASSTRHSHVVCLIVYSSH